MLPILNHPVYILQNRLNISPELTILIPSNAIRIPHFRIDQNMLFQVHLKCFNNFAKCIETNGTYFEHLP